MKPTVLEVFIPTYNRLEKFCLCLASLENALSNLNLIARSNVGISISNNSTCDLLGYHERIVFYRDLFTRLGVAYFDYKFTGFNVGAENNIVSGLLNCKSDYIWCLPDDDIARYDSLAILTSTLLSTSPSLLLAGRSKFSFIPYDSTANGNDTLIDNAICAIIPGSQKIDFFLNGNVLALQNFVFKASLVHDFLLFNDNYKLVSPVLPGLLGIICLQSTRPLVVLETSIGIFRDGDPNSSWRHLWYSIALIMWPKLCNTLYCMGFLSSVQCRQAWSVYRHLFLQLAHRPDILLGLRPRLEINPYRLFQYHRSFYLRFLFTSPVSIVLRIASLLKR